MPVRFEKVNHVYMPDSPFTAQALLDVNIQIEDGSFVGIIGHTGSGKTTLVQHINALLKPTSGKVVVMEIDTSGEKAGLRELRKYVGLVFQYPEYQLFEETVRKDVGYGPKNLRLDSAEIDRRVKWAIEHVGLCYDEVADRSPFELSGGQRRRVAFAGVLAMEPQILILDEPTAGLDPEGRANILELLQKLHSEKNMTIIMISHYMDEIAACCDRILVMSGGRVVYFEEPEKVFSHYGELTGMGLDVPWTIKLASALRARGADVPEGLLTLEQMRDFLVRKGGTGA